MIARIAEQLLGEVRAVARHRFAVDAEVLILGQYFAMALNFVTNVLMARLLGPEGYGLVALVIAYPTLLWSFIRIKSASVITRYVVSFRVQGDREKLKAVAKLSAGLDLLVSLLTLVVVALTAWWVSTHFYRQPDLAWLMVVYALSFLPSSLSGVSGAVISSWERFRWLALFTVLHPFIKLCLVGGSLLAGFGVQGVVIATGVSQAGIGLIMMVIATLLLSREGMGLWWRAPLATLDHSLKRELMVFFSWNYLLVTLSGLVGQLPLMMLGHLRGPEEAGFYRLALSIAVVSSYAETSLGKIAYPVLSAQLASRSSESVMQSLRGWTVRAGLPLGGLMVIGALLLPLVLPLLFGEAYRPMIVAAQVLLIADAFSAVFFWLFSYYYASGLIKPWVLGYALYTAVVLGGGWLVIDQWGYLGLAILTGIAKVAFTLLMRTVLLKNPKK